MDLLPPLIILAPVIAALWCWPIPTLCVLGIVGVYLWGSSGGFDRGASYDHEHPGGVGRWER